MSSFQWKALAVCAWLVALCFGIAGAAGYETYTLYRDGQRVSATVDKVAPPWLSVEYDYRDWRGDVQHQKSRLRVADAGVAPGARIALLLHRNNYEPIVAGDLSSELPSPWIVLGFLVSIAGGVPLWRVPRRHARRRAARTSAWDAVIEAAARTRNMSTGLGIFMLVAGVAFALVPLADPGSGVTAEVVIWVLAVVTLGLGGFLLRRAIRMRDPASNEVVDLLANHPRELAWFYVHQVTTEGIRASEALSVVLRTAAGKRLTLTLVRPDLDDVLAEIARRAPHAQQGYAPELERLYKEQPDRWRPTA
jgi:hypothetical protein